MGLVFLFLMLVLGASGEEARSYNRVVEPGDINEHIAGTEVVQAFVIFRHGDRTPDKEELDLAKEQPSNNVFFPYGMKALTNRGKQRGFEVGKYIRKQYYGLISELYLDDEVKVRTTSYARTKMTALTALAGLYPPLPAQRWNPALNWQPVPYDTVDFNTDDLMYWYNCPLYIKLRNAVYELPEVAALIKPYQGLFAYLQEQTGNNITTLEDVFYLDNLFQTLNNVGVRTPEWAQKVMPEIKECTKLEYAAEFYTPAETRLASGLLLQEILNATSNFINGNTEQPKLRLYSAHENNVAALMAATRVFVPHQPNYGATYAVELRRGKTSGQYFILAVYAAEAGKQGKVLPIKGCGNGLCDYDTFVSLVKDYAWSRSEFLEECQIKDEDC